MPQLAEKLASVVNSTMSQPSSNLDFEEEDLDDEEGGGMDSGRQPRIGAEVMSFLEDKLDYQELDALISQATMPEISGTARRQQEGAGSARTHPGGGEPQAKRQRQDADGQLHEDLSHIDGFLSSLEYT